MVNRQSFLVIDGYLLNPVRLVKGRCERNEWERSEQEWSEEPLGTYGVGRVYTPLAPLWAYPHTPRAGSNSQPPHTLSPVERVKGAQGLIVRPSRSS